MALKLMYITNNPEIAKIAEEAGVDRIFVDLECIGKADRQGGMDTVQSDHTPDDIKAVSSVISKAELLVRVNPIHQKAQEFCSSKDEIDIAIANGADIIMLPYFKTIEEVKLFLSYVGGRAKAMLLIETPEAVEIIDDILALGGFDYIHIGLNDLSLGYGMKFMFELLSDGTVQRLCEKFKESGIEYGFGGIASIGKGVLPAEMIISEHYNLGSTCAILSRSFCDVKNYSVLSEIESVFNKGIEEIRQHEAKCYQAQKNNDDKFFVENKKRIDAIVKDLSI